jgi:DNA polymerase III sliding clamp (beta) subunit (PCNA family)
MTDSRSITVHASRLIEAIALVRHAAASSEARAILNTVMVEGDDKGVRLVTADNYRIAIADLSEEASEFGRAIIRLRDIPLVTSIARAHKGMVELTVEDGRLTVVAGALSLGLSLADGMYPDYRHADMHWELDGRIALGVNPQFLGDVTRALSKSIGHVRIYSFPDPLKPILVTGDGFRSIIMPVRLAEATVAA